MAAPDKLSWHQINLREFMIAYYVMLIAPIITERPIVADKSEAKMVNSFGALLNSISYNSFLHYHEECDWKSNQ